MNHHTKMFQGETNMSEENIQTQTQPDQTPVIDANIEPVVAPVVDGNVAESEVKAEVEVDQTKEAEKAPVSQEDFNRLYFELKQKERELAAMKEVKPEAPKAPEVAKELTLEQFDFDEDAYQQALITQKAEEIVNKKFADVEANKTQAQNDEALKIVGEQFNKAAIEYAAKNPGYNEAIAAAGNNIFPQHINDVIMNSEVGPQLDHQLLTNPQLVTELSALTPIQAIMRLGVMEATISAKPAVQVSNAPAPIENVSGASRAAGDYRTDENMSMDEYYKNHQADLAKKAGR